MDSLEGKVAVITGAGSGIGAGIARAAASAGMRVVVSDIQLDRAQAMAKSLQEGGGEAIAAQTDVSKLESVQALADAAEAAFGPVDLLCNNAGVWVGALMHQADITDWQYQINVNLYGVIHGVTVFSPKMVSRGSGHIVNTASLGGLIAGPPEGLYCTTKFAVAGLSEALLMELAEHGVGVSVLCPGLVQSELIRNTAIRPKEVDGGKVHDVTAPDVDNGMSPDEVGRRVIDAVTDNEFWIITHGEYQDVIRMKYDGMMEAIDRHKARYG